MPTPRKRYLRKKRLFINDKYPIAVFNGSNLKTTKVNQIRLELQKAKLYNTPSYLLPPKLAKGYPLIIIVYETEDDLQQNLPKIMDKLDCLGICIKNKWYTVNLLNKNKLNGLNKKLLSLLLIRKEKIQ